MKTKLLLILLFPLLLQAQENYQHIVVSARTGDTVYHCLITKQIEPNIVFYEKAGESFRVQAKAINLNGEFIILKNENPRIVLASEPNYPINRLSYLDYKELKIKAHKQAITGVTFIAVGAVITFVGQEMIKSTPPGDIIPTIVFLGGIAIANIGIPIFLTGITKERKNTLAMKRTKPKDLSLKLGVSSNGIGICLTF